MKEKLWAKEDEGKRAAAKASKKKGKKVEAAQEGAADLDRGGAPETAGQPESKGKE